jgi:hypothetical protein
VDFDINLSLSCKEKRICFKSVDSGDHLSESTFAHQSVFRLLAAVTELSLG